MATITQIIITTIVRSTESRLAMNSWKDNRCSLFFYSEEEMVLHLEREHGIKTEGWHLLDQRPLPEGVTERPERILEPSSGICPRCGALCWVKAFQLDDMGKAKGLCAGEVHTVETHPDVYTHYCEKHGCPDWA